MSPDFVHCKLYHASAQLAT